MWRQGGGEGDPNRVHDFLAFLSFSQQWGTTQESLGGADRFQRVPRGGRAVHPVSNPYNELWVGPRGSGSRVMGASWGPPGTDLSGGPRAGSRHRSC